MCFWHRVFPGASPLHLTGGTVCVTIYLSSCWMQNASTVEKCNHQCPFCKGKVHAPSGPFSVLAALGNVLCRGRVHHFDISSVPIHFSGRPFYQCICCVLCSVAGVDEGCWCWCKLFSVLLCTVGMYSHDQMVMWLLPYSSVFVHPASQ
jgi:hypothetical protein